MRVALGIHKTDLESVFQTYELMSKRWFTHATPTLFYSGTCTPQMSSCFVVTMQDDSLEGIYSTLFKCAMISKSAGGIGLSIHKIRASGSYIRGTNGHSNGIVPMLRVFNDTARYVDQGGGKRKGAIAIYLVSHLIISSCSFFSGTMARRHRLLPSTQEELRRRGTPCQRPLLRCLDPGSLYEQSGR